MKKSSVFKEKKAQVTLFVIIAIVLIAAISFGFYYAKNKAKISAGDFSPIQDYLVSCLKQKAENAVLVLGLQGGYIETPELQQGSGYMPFSSQLDFLGTNVPYWAYFDRNGIFTEQIPTITSMQNQLSNYLNEEIKTCDFSSFQEQGFSFILPEKASTSVKISNGKIDITLDYPIRISKGENSGKLSTIQSSLNSNLGKMYNSAREIYAYKSKSNFLENYSLDVLSLYAPTTDVEISCAPKTWLKSEIKDTVQKALEANIASIRFQGTKGDNYFAVPVSVQGSANAIYSPSWPIKFEVYGGDINTEQSDLILAEPVGIQPGLSVMGFCYVPYHFVYDLAYPVMIQIFDSKEIFQFPVVVNIEKNSAGKPSGEILSETQEQICNHPNTDVRITTSDREGNPVESDVYFKCLNEQCNLGETKISSGNAILNTQSPQCIGSYFMAEASGYAESKVQEDVIDSKEVNIILDKLYQISVDPDVSNSVLLPNDFAVISFVSNDYSTTLVYPQDKTVELKEGYYNVSINVYSQGNIEIPGYQDQQCFTTPADGLAGILGFEQEKCIDINLPSQKITQVISGAGTTSIFVTDSDLQQAQKIRISASYISLPKTLEDLQDIYLTIDENPAEVTIE